MKRVLIAFIILYIVGGCGKKEEGVSTEDAKGIAQSVASFTQDMAGKASEPANFTPSSPIKGGITTQGNMTDQDKDGITVSGKWIFDIDTTLLGVHYLMKGEITHDDSILGDDSDPFKWHIIIGNGNYFIMETMGYKIRMKGEVIASHQNNTYTLQFKDFCYDFTLDTLQAAISYNLTYSITPKNVNWQPGNALTEANISISGEMSYPNINYAITIETTKELHYNSGKIDDGIIEITINNTKVTIEYQSDGNYVIKLNGKIIS